MRREHGRVECTSGRRVQSLATDEDAVRKFAETGNNTLKLMRDKETLFRMTKDQ